MSTHLGMLTARAVRTCLRTPSLILSPLLMSVFFMVVYEGQFSALADAIAPGSNYVDTVLPLFALTLAFTGGAVSGQLLLRDIESGYFTRLSLTSGRRSAMITAPLLAGVVVLAAQAAILVLLARLMGLHAPAGWIGLLAVVGATCLIGTGFLLLAAAAAIWAGTASAVNAVTYLFFPLSFLTAALVPRDRLEGWTAAAADVNPLTYLLDGLRTLLTDQWQTGDLAWAGLTTLVLLAAGVVAVRLAFVRRFRMGA